jgi:SEC-C motif domain protein
MPRARPSRNQPCPCGTGRRYKACCLPLHGGTAAASAQALMRSRYAAYALGIVRYILRTTHPAGPHHRADTKAWAAEVEAFCSHTQFTGLRVDESHEDGDRGEVAFFASLTREGKDVSFGERSRFERVDGRWLYHSGTPHTP